VADDAPVALTGEPRPFVSRGGGKLRAALDRFAVDVDGAWCLDAGASTGGVTDFLLQAGAARVIAVDVGGTPAVPDAGAVPVAVPVAAVPAASLPRLVARSPAEILDEIRDDVAELEPPTDT